ncbi:MAG: TetR/AcrR family transcriptional regulator [Deltaproteobacteria bacterium]|nr:TetR/AcrR family transcriptional regulator [Deltaproteobacteria bacterium]MBW2396163.1 TetR/AcrR family transcriptional regulator [Deltaproteobacteria bacterium]
MQTKTQTLDFAPKKLPSQRRSQETFRAMVEACAWLLPRKGYAGTTTNHIAERAGVNIASLYEYFPGKDAIVVQVARGLVERVLERLALGAAEVLEGREDQALRTWIQLIHDTVAREKGLIAVFMYQVPYTSQLEPIQAISARLLEQSQQVHGHAGHFFRPNLSDATLQLVINLVNSTIMQLVMNPPKHYPKQELLDELIVRVEEWIGQRPN